MKQRVLHQFLNGASVGDAITDQALLIRHWLRETGFDSHIYAEHIHPAMVEEVRPFDSYQPGADEEYVVYHHGIGSATVGLLQTLALKIILVYHNVTPPGFYKSTNPQLAKQLAEGQAQLGILPSQTPLALADSAYNELDLIDKGFARTGVLPIALVEEKYDLASDPALIKAYAGSGPLLLFLGRLAPNKKQEDLIKLLYYYRRIQPDARLLLVGDPWAPEYVGWLKSLAESLGLGQAVIFVGHVNQAQMVTYFRLAHLYVSMSEHEGFGKPLIEGMHLGLPILAYATSAVPYTMGEAGVLFHHKHFPALAELVDMLVTDKSLRARIVSRQQTHARLFLESQVRYTWMEAVASL